MEGRGQVLSPDIGMEFVVERSQRLPVWSRCSKLLRRGELQDQYAWLLSDSVLLRGVQMLRNLQKSRRNFLE